MAQRAVCSTKVCPVILHTTCIKHLSSPYLMGNIQRHYISHKEPTFSYRHPQPAGLKFLFGEVLIIRLISSHLPVLPFRQRNYLSKVISLNNFVLKSNLCCKSLSLVSVIFYMSEENSRFRVLIIYYKL